MYSLCAKILCVHTFLYWFGPIADWRLFSLYLETRPNRAHLSLLLAKNAPKLAGKTNDYWQTMSGPDCYTLLTWWCEIWPPIGSCHYMCDWLICEQNGDTTAVVELGYVIIYCRLMWSMGIPLTFWHWQSLTHSQRQAICCGCARRLRNSLLAGPGSITIICKHHTLDKPSVLFPQ